ncbi:MAG: adenylate/guanylate cyclase domain-containing protein [Polyangiaceae bacterium]|nr:adenylate/guanylate cyclase domain-containing protein [Polyangiaceae bacterium]
MSEDHRDDAGPPTVTADPRVTAVLGVVATMNMTEIVRLQDVISREITRRFERKVTVAFSDIVDSTRYFATHGDEAGRKLQQRHRDFLAKALWGRDDAWIVDTAGDGAFLCFPTVESAVDALVALQRTIAEDNAARLPSAQLHVRVGIHFGPALADGLQVSGEAVNIAARVASSAEIDGIRLTLDAFHEMREPSKRGSCVPLPPAVLKGLPHALDLVRFEWRPPSGVPERIRIIETGKEITLPATDPISFGRMANAPGVRGNDVVLALDDDQASMKISRWHFELRRKGDGFVLRQLAENLTEVDGKRVARGQEAPIAAGARVNVGGVLTLVFDPPAARRSVADSTMV